MRLPSSAHEAHAWAIDEIAPDFRLVDVWALPVGGGRDEFDDLLEVMASFDPAEADSAITRLLFSIRFRVGGWLGWDDPAKKHRIPGCAETTLRDRLPEHLRESATTAAFTGTTERVGGFVPLYRTDEEWAAEISNATVHGVLHLGWVDQGEGVYRAQMAVYVKPRGPLGAAYLKAIEPFRHFVVYPALLRQIGRAWDGRRTR